MFIKKKTSTYFITTLSSSDRSKTKLDQKKKRISYGSIYPVYVVVWIPFTPPLTGVATVSTTF